MSQRRRRGGHRTQEKEQRRRPAHLPIRLALHATKGMDKEKKGTQRGGTGSAALPHLLVQVSLHQRQLHRLLDLLLLDVHAANVLRRQGGGGSMRGGQGRRAARVMQCAGRQAGRLQARAKCTAARAAQLPGLRRGRDGAAGTGRGRAAGTPVAVTARGAPPSPPTSPHTPPSEPREMPRKATHPPTWYVTSGRSVWDMTEMVESASGGSMSTSALEWRCSATDALGRSSSLWRRGAGRGGDEAACRHARAAPAVGRRSISQAAAAAAVHAGAAARLWQQEAAQ